MANFISNTYTLKREILSFSNKISPVLSLLISLLDSIFEKNCLSFPIPS